MTEITDAHVEWAVVDRLRQMLNEPPETKFDVTQTYALFTSVLCWTLQRIRADGDEDADRLAKSVKEKLCTEQVGAAPWHVPTSPIAKDILPIETFQGVGPFEDFHGQNAFKLLLRLRNAVAHGDARIIEPYQQPANPSSDVKLTGFVFRCKDRDDWQGSIILPAGDMRRIGSALASRFCDALRGIEESQGVSHFEDDARAHVQEVALP